MSVNKVILIGNVGKDPEVRYLDNNNVVARFPLATTERGYTGRDGKQIPDRTEWHNIVVWRGLAERAERELKKGNLAYIEGKITHRKYTDKDGVERSTTEIVANSVSSLDRKENKNQSLSSGFPGVEDDPFNKIPNTSTSIPNQASAPEDDLPF